MEPGDFLIVRTNGSPDLIGRGAVVPDSLEENYLFASYLIRYRFCGPDMLARWLKIAWHAPYTRRKTKQMSSSSAGQYNLSITKIDEIPLPLPPLAEQSRLVEKISDFEEPIVRTRRRATDAIPRTEALESSLLADAFAG